MEPRTQATCAAESGAKRRDQSLWRCLDCEWIPDVKTLSYLHGRGLVWLDHVSELVLPS